jgi:hypothetical protein
MNTRRSGVLLAGGFALVFACGLAAGMFASPRLAQAIDFESLAKADQLWAVFKDFLKREDQQLREFTPQGGAKLAQYQKHRKEFRQFLGAGESVVDWETLDQMEEVEKIQRILQEIDQNWGRGNAEKSKAFLADLETVLVERAAALEVLRFSTPAYAKDLLDPDTQVQWLVIWNDLGTRRPLLGTIDKLYEKRVAELSAGLKK